MTVSNMSVRDPAAKVVSRDDLILRYGRPRSDTVVFTNGCFDLLHPGHVTYLAAARVLGDRLVVGVNTDASVKRLGKGGERPLAPESDRAVVVAGLESVDAVCLFDEDTPHALIEALLPDVLVKGGDYELEGVVGRDVVEQSGGRVVLIPLMEGHSTTDLIARVRGASS